MPLDQTDGSAFEHHPLAVTHEATRLGAYYLAKDKPDADNQKTIRTLNDGLIKAYKQSKVDGDFDFTKVEGMGSTSDDVEAKLILMHSELAGTRLALNENVKAAAEKEAEKAQAEEDRLKGTVKPRKRAQIADLPDPYDAFMEASNDRTMHDIADGLSAGASERFVREIPEGIRGRDIKAAVFTTTQYDPFNVRDPGTTLAPRRRLYMIGEIPGLPLTQAAAVFMREANPTVAAAAVAENAELPETTYDVDEITRKAEVIGHYVPVTEQVLEDEDEARNYLDQVMPMDTMLAADRAIVLGNGTSPQVEGIRDVAGAGSVTLGGTVAATEDYFDTIADAENNVEFTGRAMPTHIALHPTVWNATKKSKGTDKHYYGGDPFTGFTEMAWGYPVIKNDNFQSGATANDKVGAMLDLTGRYLQLRFRRAVTTEIGRIDKDFVTLRYTIRSYLRMAVVIKRPSSICIIQAPSA